MALSPEKPDAHRSNTKKPKRRDRSARRRNSPLNAIRDGMFAQSVLLSGESRERLLKLLADLTTEFEAVTQNELALTGTMTFSRRYVVRNRTFQAAQISREQRLQSDSAAVQDSPTQSVLALQSVDQPPTDLETIRRLVGGLAANITVPWTTSPRPKEKKTKGSHFSDENKEHSQQTDPIRPMNDPPTTRQRTAINPILCSDRTNQMQTLHLHV